MKKYRFIIICKTKDGEVITAKSNVSAKKCESYIDKIRFDDAGYEYIKFLGAEYHYFRDDKEREYCDFRRDGINLL